MKWFEPAPAMNLSWWWRLSPSLVGMTMAAIALPLATSPPTRLLTTVLALAASMQLRVPSGSHRKFGMAVSIGAATPIFLGSAQTVDLAGVLVVYGAGLALGISMLLLRPSQLSYVRVHFYRLLAMTAYALVFTWLSGSTLLSWVSDGWRVMIPLAVGAFAWLVVETFLFELEHGWRRIRLHPGQDLLGDLNVFVSLVAAGALFAIAYRRLGMWALGVAGLPFIFAQSAFARFLTIKRTYRQTIRALARIPEVAGLGVDGHADRTAKLATEVGSDLGLSLTEMDDLEYAALMHDIGRITLTEPAIVRIGYTDADIARWGAEIIAQAPYLDRIAEHIRQLHEPYRKPGEQSDPSISMISKIVRAASAYDHLVAERRLSPLQAVEVLHQGAVYDYDPAVVASMRRILEKRMAFHPTAVRV